MGLLLGMLEVNMENCDEKEVAAQVIPLAFLFVEQYDESLEWNSPDDDTEQVDFQFDGEIFLSVAQPIITKGLKSDQWVNQVGSLFVIKHILDGVAGLWQSQLDTIVKAVGNCLAHSKAQVKYAALHAIQQLSVSYAEQDFESTYHRPIMSALLDMVNSASKQHRCVAVQTCDALAHFAYYCKQELFDDYSKQSLKSLYEVLVNCNDGLINRLH
ncbi:hypothetical protein RFI_40340 [Reticulomyxa filosa]|uniref:Uncharacterized protein n=1 Tax=Reticulomyxa filosa TaxID=46433 RepID=X6L6Y6_RETFI|nr:hypothetical protein RFI_40340 [Reticulomyxa filosa]|eukprot:ETN97192.1 hypothetical protein RFI_40340 [Reticulomyxa filosa]